MIHTPLNTMKRTEDKSARCPDDECYRWNEGFGSPCKEFCLLKLREEHALQNHPR
jgi:hypothetical protein